ncbi:MAG: Serine/threonine protein kinase [Myxococcaceae bacterium]|nr:Serine/threonine protein kinase [Myxococcaceae bacterium]
MSREPTTRQSVPPGQRLPLAGDNEGESAAGERSSEPELGIRVGDLLEGRYQIEERIGEGGVGVVYRALQLKLHRRVAVKLLLQDTIGEEAIRPRFEQEALTLAAVSHPHIVGLQDYGMVRGRPFLVMEFLEGRTLRQIIDSEGALEPLRALSLLRQLTLALAYAHELGVVHRDLKPANLIVLALPSYEHVKVLDFGMVKLLPGSALSRGENLTRAGFTFGTPAYMSPEHALGGDVDGRSDLYAAGVLLFELLTGQKPWDGEVQDVLRHHLQSPIPQLEQRRPELADYPELQGLVDRAMAKEPAARFADATELLTAIDELLRSGLLADAPLGAEQDEDEQGDERTSLGPRMRETLETAAAALSSYARSSRELFRDKASPQLRRARRELAVVAARMAPTLRRLSTSAWGKLRPQLLQAAERLARLAHDARGRIALEARKQREKRAAREAGLPLALPRVSPVKQERPARPPKTELLPVTEVDATVVDLPPPEAQAERARTVPGGRRAHHGTLSEFGGQAGTAEPLTLQTRTDQASEPRKP